MSATASSLRDPRVLPGVSAFTWTRIYLAGYAIGLIVWIPFFVLSALNGFSRSSSGVFVIVFLVVLLPTVFGLIGRRRLSKESAAGYTTILKSGGTLDLLDSRSGAVIWRAGDPPVRSVGFLGTLRGEQAAPARESSSGEPAFPPKSTSSRIVQLAPFLGGIGAVVVVLVTTRGKMTVWEIALIYLGLAALAGLIVLIVYAQTRLTLGRRIQVLSALRPESMIFTSTGSRALSDALAPLGVASVRSGRFPVVVTDSGIEFWGSEGDAPWLSVPWSEVTRIDPDTVPIGRNIFRAVTFSLERDDRRVSATLPLYGRQGIYAASPTWANQVFDELQFHLVKR